MGKEQCPYGFRKQGDVSLHCRLLEQEKFSQCAHQYFCGQTRRWEATPQAGQCPLRKKSKA